MTDNEPREMTCAERAAIRKLVVSLCANYDREYGCLLLNNECYMFGVIWTSSYCKYFRNAVLPDDAALEAALTGKAIETRSCGICGESFPANRKKAYCSETCTRKAQRRQQREYMRKKRGVS